MLSEILIEHIGSWFLTWSSWRARCFWGCFPQFLWQSTDVSLSPGLHPSPTGKMGDESVGKSQWLPLWISVGLSWLPCPWLCDSICTTPWLTVWSLVWNCAYMLWCSWWPLCGSKLHMLRPYHSSMLYSVCCIVVLVHECKCHMLGSCITNGLPVNRFMIVWSFSSGIMIEWVPYLMDTCSNLMSTCLMWYVIPSTC